ncbi:hypothetical protein RA307_01615 [Xanthobacteraceae bacterium Astr-EGSB]|uniref:hypothetical protein n=1 Tax=Astrobacterium formosum TaxID=3069710 RepID=UPI0027B22693|nr:hypothetical protein [Xanthobacteraceae bacterium Astr-EGSB]
MRVWTLPIVALGVAMASLSMDDQPGEYAMRTAFESSLAAQVRSALDFAAETGGQDAVNKIREARTDYFEIRTFRKLYCMSGDKGGHMCAFAVDIGLRDGTLQQILLGRFFQRDDGLAFTHAA